MTTKFLTPQEVATIATTHLDPIEAEAYATNGSHIQFAAEGPHGQVRSVTFTYRLYDGTVTERTTYTELLGPYGIKHIQSYYGATNPTEARAHSGQYVPAKHQDI